MASFASVSLPGIYSWAVIGVVCLVLGHQFVVSDKKTKQPAKIPFSSQKYDSNRKGSHAATFPPSQRRLLAQIASRDVTNATEIDTPTLSSRLLRKDEEYDAVEPGRTLFSGFTVGDVRMLGNFPDYATLSEVRLPKPLDDFGIKTAQGRPYRPFRWPYHQTMAIHKMDNDFWIELDKTYEEQIQTRKDIYDQHGTDIMQALPGSKLACKELVEMVIEFVCARYPKQFERRGGTFTNHILGKTYDVASTDPLTLLLENVPEDFAVMLRDPETGNYQFRAGVICASTGWSLGTKIGKGLPDIHSPVPDYKEKMQFSMDRFFTKMPASKPVQRGAWGFEVGKHLYTPPDHSDLDHRAVQDPTLRPEDIYLRVDWQTLRRLPLSGAIVFNFKVFFTPVADLRDEPYIPSLSLKVFSESKDNLRSYKQVYHTEHVLKPLLEEFERHQIDRGIIEKDWEHHTLAENPFFPGWEAKWLQRQRPA